MVVAEEDSLLDDCHDCKMIAMANKPLLICGKLLTQHSQTTCRVEWILTQDAEGREGGREGGKKGGNQREQNNKVKRAKAYGNAS